VKRGRFASGDGLCGEPSASLFRDWLGTTVPVTGLSAWPARRDFLVCPWPFTIPALAGCDTGVYGSTAVEVDEVKSGRFNYSPWNNLRFVFGYFRVRVREVVVLVLKEEWNLSSRGIGLLYTIS
jgi:hypothetical protein